MRFLIFILLIFISVSMTLAQQRVNKKSLDSAIKTIREKTKVPLRLPTYFPYQPFATARDKRKVLYPSIMGGGNELVDEDGFQLNFCFSRITCFGGYFYAEISGEKITPDQEKTSFDKTVKLAKGITGYFSEASCGSSCAPASLTWEQDGYRYTAFLEVNNVNTLVKFVNSAINNNSLIKGKAL